MSCLCGVCGALPCAIKKFDFHRSLESRVNFEKERKGDPLDQRGKTSFPARHVQALSSRILGGADVKVGGEVVGSVGGGNGAEPAGIASSARCDGWVGSSS